MLPNGDFDKMEPFFEGIKVNSLIDMEVGPDGKLYLLEYGSGWFTKNPDAGLARIDFNAGNRPPKIDSFNVTSTSGILPFSIKASLAARDPENDKIEFHNLYFLYKPKNPNEKITAGIASIQFK